MSAFSVTERQNAKRCPRLHRLSSKGGAHLGLIIPPVYLGVGSLIHSGSQAWLPAKADPSSPGHLLSYADHVTIASERLLTKSRERYRKQIGAAMSAEEEEPLWEAISYARTMAENYELRWGSPLPDGFTLIRTEQRVLVPVPGTEHECPKCLGDGYARDVYGQAVGDPCPDCDGSRVEYHYLDGRFDGLIQRDDGLIFILEHKTYNARPSDESLDHNDQFLAYIWLAIQLGIGDIGGLAYDGLWRRDAVPKGRSFEDLFLRKDITRSRNELLEFQRMLPHELNFMAAQLEADEDPWINRRWQGCYDCSFADKHTRSVHRTGLCTAISKGENVAGVRALYYTERDDDLDPDDLETELEA